MDCICLVPADAEVHAHARNLEEIAEGQETFRWSYVENKKDIARVLSRTDASDLYLLAHSAKESGMLLPDQSILYANELVQMFSLRKQNMPEFILFNTCYGSTNGFAEQFVVSGVRKIISIEGSIDKVKAMRAAEAIFKLKPGQSHSLENDFGIAMSDQTISRQFRFFGF